jgi:WD40 repeat protein/serine/threonine protein kinase
LAATKPPQVPDYELLRLIGRGSYGEVWLGRSVTGVLRAVKVIHRHTFESDRPYEREFRGIQKFEPVAMTHESQLDVLHVGRNDAEGYFYYVLELADDVNAVGQPASARPDWQGYTPHTLREDLKRNGQISFAACVELGIRLATALDHLHRHGLAHRDVKPSNIVFVGGAPKLTDIGLVAAQDDSMSFVGTPGYLAPEGPGSAQADLYSLGKVLYEASTGKDRLEFPEPATELSADADAAAQAELNEIVLRACAQDPRQRYGSAAELRADLLLLQSGRSVRRLRVLERRMALTWRVLAIAVLLTLLGAGGFLYQQRQTRQLSDLAEQSRQRLVRLHVSNSLHLQGTGDSLASLVWLVEALKLARTPAEEDMQRRRVGSLLRSTPALVQMGAHEGPINHAEFSVDGRWLVTVSDDHTGSVWDVKTGQAKARLVGHSAPVSHASFGPEARRVITASDDGTARIWDAKTGTLLFDPLRHEDSVLYAWFDPAGRRVVTASADSSARLWDADTGRPLFEPLRHENVVEFACFSPDGRLAVTVSTDRTARLWETSTGQPAAPPLLHSHAVTYAAFSPDSRMLVTGGRDAAASRWDVASGERIDPPLEHIGRVRYLRFSSDGRRILVAGGEHSHTGEARVWDAATGEGISPPLRHLLRVTHAAFSPDGHRVATASADHTVRIWNAVSGEQIGSTLRHPLRAWFVEFSPDGRYLVTAGRERIWRLWDLETAADAIEWHPMATPQRWFTEHSWRAVTNLYARDRVLDVLQGERPLAISPDGRWILTHDLRGEGRLRDITTGAPVSTPIRHERKIAAAEFSRDGSRLATSSDDQTARIWEVPSGKPITPPLEHRYPVYRAVFSSDGTRLATAAKDLDPFGGGEARIWNVIYGQLAVPVLEHQAAVWDAAFSPDGRILATAGGSPTSQPHAAWLWDTQTGRQIGPPFHHDENVGVAVFSPDGRWLATGTGVGTSQIWNVATGQPAGPPLEHLRGINSIGFSPDTRMLAIASADGNVRIWERTSGELVAHVAATGHPLVGAPFSHDGNWLLINRLDARSAILSVGPDPRPIHELEAVARIAAGIQVNPDGSSQPLSSDDILNLFQRLNRMSISPGQRQVKIDRQINSRND